MQTTRLFRLGESGKEARRFGGFDGSLSLVYSVFPVMSSPSRMQRNSKDSRHGGVQFLWQLWRRDTLQMDKIRKLKLQSDKNAGLSIDATYIATDALHMLCTPRRE